jgi:hypothetical protein
MQTNVEYRWEDIKVGDIITVELPYPYYAPQQLTGEVVSIRYVPAINTNDPLITRVLNGVGYHIRIKTDELYEFPFSMEDRNKEYVIQSHIWKLTNIERKNKMETQEQQFREGDTVLVISNDVKISLGFPKDEKLTAEIVCCNTKNNILIHSEQLEKLHLGHDGDKPQQFPNRGCWWVSEKSLQLVKRGSENEFDIFI